mmetsp:Transcript_7870/g.19530  ORF Transcript_7870/g.19530 Transcript_7870/m.19530 type:complete len:218 (-) Transcript_7870:289-942(-)
MQDPFFAVKEEVEHSVTVVTQLHTKWEELRATKHGGDEFEWTTSELLSGLRSIEWDLQDLEDTVSIVKGNRLKFQLDDADVQAREDFIEMTRQQITAMRDQVQGSSAAESPGFSTKGGGSGLPSIGKSKGYARAGGEESVPLGQGDLEMNGLPAGRDQPMASAANDEILGADLSINTPIPSRNRHAIKKAVLGLTILVLLGMGAAAAKMSGGGGGGE